jgi:hypothetical protein
MLGMHRFAVVRASLLLVIAFSGASAADLPQRTYTKARPALALPLYDLYGHYIGPASSQVCYTVTSAGVAVVQNSESCRSVTGDAFVTDNNKYYLLFAPHFSERFRGPSF